VGAHTGTLRVNAGNGGYKDAALSFTVNNSEAGVYGTTTHDGQIVYYYAFDPLRADWDFRLTGETYSEIKRVEHYYTAETKFMINAAYFGGDTPVAHGVNFINGKDVNLGGYYDGIVGTSDYRNMRVLFYFYDGTTQVFPYSEVRTLFTEETGVTWVSDEMKRKAESAKFVITGNDGNRATESIGRTALGVKDDGTVIIVAARNLRANQITAALHNMNATKIVVLDGGASTQLYANGSMRIYGGRAVHSIIEIK